MAVDHICACGVRFATFVAIVSHWEKSRCITNIRELNRLVLRFDEQESLVISSLKGHLNGTHFRIDYAPDDCFDRVSCMFICPFDGCGEDFTELDLLNIHLASPFHDVKAFRCPGAQCSQTFSTLSGMLQHVESTACSGGIEAGSGCLGKLRKFLMKELGLSADAPTIEDSSDSLL